MKDIQDRKRLVIMDADTIAYVACHNKEGQEKSLDDVKNHIDSLITSNLMTLNAYCFLGALTIGKCFRYKINPNYKLNRKDLKPLAYIKEAREHMINKWGFMHHPDLEADDIVHILRKHFEPNYEVVVVATDKDVLNLEGTNYNPRTDKFYFNEQHDADFALFKQVLTGDTIDNIKGVHGIGPKKADKILENPYTNLWQKTLQIYLDNSSSFDVALDNFYMNYKCLKIVDTWPGFDVDGIVPKLVSEIDTEQEQDPLF